MIRLNIWLSATDKLQHLQQGCHAQLSMSLSHKDLKHDLSRLLEYASEA